jgi:hypothetical protein
MDPEKKIEQVSEMTTPDGKNLAAVALGRKGGAVRSKAKIRASRENALKAHAANRRKGKERRKKIEANEKSVA